MLSNLLLEKPQNTTRDIRQANRLQILHYLLLRTTCTRQELSQATSLSTATVANLVAAMLDEGLVVETGIVASQGGRPTAILGINASAGASVGVDVAETYIHFDLYDLTLKKLAEYEVELPGSEKKPHDIVRMISSGLNELLLQVKLPIEKVIGMGIAIPGPFEHATGVSVFAPSWGWVNVSLKALLEKEIKIPLYMDNPLKFNAIAEAWFGAGRGVDTMAAVVLGTGVGAGLMINGQLFHGASNTAGEWGHSIIVAGGRLCRCGSHGCVEAYVGAPGILQTLAEIDPNSPLIFADDQMRSIAAIANAARLGDAAALAVVHQTALYLSAGISNIVNIINPSMVILGSWVAHLLGPVMLPDLLKLVEQQSLSQPYKAFRLVVSDTDRNLVSLGAATLVIEEFLSEVRQKPGTALSEELTPTTANA